MRIRAQKPCGATRIHIEFTCKNGISIDNIYTCPVDQAIGVGSINNET